MNQYIYPAYRCVSVGGPILDVPVPPPDQPLPPPSGGGGSQPTPPKPTDPALTIAKLYLAAEAKAVAAQDWQAAITAVQRLIKLVQSNPTRAAELDPGTPKAPDRLALYLQNAGQMGADTGGGGSAGWWIAGALVAGILGWKAGIFNNKTSGAT